MPESDSDHGIDEALEGEIVEEGGEQAGARRRRERRLGRPFGQRSPPRLRQRHLHGAGRRGGYQGSAATWRP